MTARQIAQNELRWTRGYQVSAHDWMRLLENSSDLRFQNLYHAIRYGLQTGRLPNWERGEDWQRFFTQDNQRLSNVQMRNLLARAADRQESLTTASGLDALQSEFGLQVA